MLHVFNNLVDPDPDATKSYSIYAGVQDAFMQWWYGHNAVAFFLTTPFLGLMYYFLPKAADRPVFSYKLSILHFWSLVFIYIWAGPHHLHYTALPGVGQHAGDVVQRDAVDAVVGRDDQRFADTCAGPGTRSPPIRC
jgi:cbb3-type cytochrome oxidase subunit 1